MSQITKECPICNSSKYSPSYEIRGHVYYSCNTCGMLYLRDMKDALTHIDKQSVCRQPGYDADYFKGTLKKSMSGYMNYAKQSQPLRMNFRNFLSHINQHISIDKTKSLLDVGCAYGFFLDEARKQGLSVYGLDLSASAIQWMEENLGIKGTVGLSSDAPEGPFDVITAIEVIEHVYEPRLFLRDLYKRLKKGGILVIITGANDSPIVRLLGRRWWYLNPPDHCSIFSRVALKRLILEEGFGLLKHTLIPFHWAGLNNLFLKTARIFESKWLGQLASKLPTIVVPVFHFSAQFLIAKKL